MWQDLYPAKYIATFSTGRGIMKPNDPLTPFHMDTKSTPWNANACRFLKDCGYSYPELQKWLPIYQTAGKFDNVKYQKALRTAIELKYSTTGKSTLQLKENSGLADAHLLSLPVMNMALENFPPVLVQKAQELKAEQASSNPMISTMMQASGPKGPQKPIQESKMSLAEILTKASSPAAATQIFSITSAVSPVAKEKWKENDYIVNVLFDRYAFSPFPYSQLLRWRSLNNHHLVNYIVYR